MFERHTLQRRALVIFVENISREYCLVDIFNNVFKAIVGVFYLYP